MKDTKSMVSDRKASIAIPDTSALLKEPKLIDRLLNDFYQVVIPDVVYKELNYQKDRGKNPKLAWEVMATINNYSDKYSKKLKIIDCERSEKKINDERIVELAKMIEKKENRKVYLIHDDVGLSISYSNSILLMEYIKLESESKNFKKLCQLNEEFDNFDDYKKNDDLNLNDYLEGGNTLLINCIKCNNINGKNAAKAKIISEKKINDKIEFLLSNGADPNKTDHSHYGLTPLAHCVQERNLTAFNILLEHGADYNKGSIDESTPSKLKKRNINEGNTPLMIACWHGYKEFVERLCMFDDISLNQQDSNGYTALIKCAVKRYEIKKKKFDCKKIESIYQYLLGIDKVDILIRDRDNRTAKDWWDLADALDKDPGIND